MMPQNLIEFSAHVVELFSGDEEPSDSSLPSVPLSPTDLFLVATSLLDRAGAFPHFDPAFDNETSTYPPSFRLSGTENRKIQSLGKDWADNLQAGWSAKVPEDIEEIWKTLFRLYGHLPVRQQAGFAEAPPWWLLALKLLVASDEAASGIADSGAEKVSDYISTLNYEVIEKPRKNATAKGVHRRDFKGATGSAASFALNGRKEVANVFPKLNIPETGCSHRNFSKNLTVLPSTGNVRCHWHKPQSELYDDTEKTVDILLVPYPFSISAKAFREAGDHHLASKAQKDDSDRQWANFQIRQEDFGGSEELKELIPKLVEAAQKDVDSVNGVILPEYSTKFSEFHMIGHNLKNEIERNLEFFIAGSSDNCDGHRGNHVLTTLWANVRSTSESKKRAELFGMTSSRRKHHRWKLDRDQIDSYGLSSTLDPRIPWWENHISGFRELHFYPFRKHSLFTTLICEDLARIDPCHEVLKSVGANLVFSLLMDGPQIRDRWPARYSRSITEDIGCSVLTMTSYGLIDRANNCGVHEKNETIAYFSSPFGNREIKLPYSSGARGVLLSLTSEDAGTQATIDGRAKLRRTWRLANVRPITP